MNRWRIAFALGILVSLNAGWARGQVQSVPGVAPIPSRSSQGPQPPEVSDTVEPAPATLTPPVDHGVPIADLANACASSSQTRIEVDPSLQGLMIQQRVRAEGVPGNYCGSFAAALRAQGLTIIKNGDAYHIVEGSEQPDVPLSAP